MENDAGTRTRTRKIRWRWRSGLVNRNRVCAAAYLGDRDSQEATGISGEEVNLRWAAEALQEDATALAVLGLGLLEVVAAGAAKKVSAMIEKESDPEWEVASLADAIGHDEVDEVDCEAGRP